MRGSFTSSNVEDLKQTPEIKHHRRGGAVDSLVLLGAGRSLKPFSTWVRFGSIHCRIPAKTMVCDAEPS